MKYFTLLFAVLLVGCSVDNPTQHSYTTEQRDEATNLTLLPSSEMWISFERVVQLYTNMQECVGLSTNPDTDETVIAWRSFENSADWFTRDTGGVVPALGAGWGFTININGTPYIFVNTDLDKPPHIYQGFDRDEYTDTQTAKHEFIHAISMHTNAHIEHGEIFTNCDAWVNTYN